MKKIRMGDWVLYTVVFLAVIAVLAPQQLPVVAYKAALLGLGAVGGYALDRSLFPYARPHEYCVPGQFAVGVMCMLRRAIVVGCTVLAVGIAL